MKKNYLFAVAFVAAALSGCSQEELVDFNSEVKSDFTATMETVESRTVLDENNKVQWVVNDDHVSLFEKVDINSKYQVSSVDDNGTAKLVYVTHIEKADYQTLDKYYAVYPYSDTNTIGTDGTITAPVSDTYTYKDKESCIASALMVACSDSKSLRFTNAQGIIRLRINAQTPYTWGKIQSVTFTSKANYLSGTAIMSWNGTETPVAVIDTKASVKGQSLTINLDESLKKDLPSKQSGDYAEFYVPVVPTTFEEEDLTMVVKFADDKTYELKDIKKEIAIARKEIITLRHTIGSDDFYADIENEAFSKEVEATTITNAFTVDGNDIKQNVSNIIFGKIADYPEIIRNYKATEADGISIYQVLNEDNTSYTIYYLSDKKISAPADSYMLFYEMKGLSEFDASNLDMSKVDNAKSMFTNCENLVSIKGIEDWDMSNVTNMQSIFYGCKKLKNIDVSNWDTSNVTNMRMVFFRCYELTDEDLKGVENWDVSNVTTFYSMFKHAYGMTSLDLSKWNTSSATNMSHMFANIGEKLTTLDLSSFDTSNVTDMSWMFYSANKLTTIYVGNGWTTKALDPANPTCFYNNQSLIGGNGTKWLDVCDMANANRPWESSAKLNYAIVDGGTENPGLLTYKSND